MKILITGATGFIGSNLIDYLNKKDTYKITKVVRKKRNQKNDVGTSFTIDCIAPNTEWSDVLKGQEIVIHLAARAHILNDTNKDPFEEFMRINKEATLNLAEQAAKNGVKRFIFLSSIGVNGNNTTNTPFSEESPENPIGPYAISKYEAELGLREIEKKTNMDIVIIRPPLVYGASAPGNFSRLIKLLSYRVPLPLGSINNKRSFISVENLVHFIHTCIDHPLAANQTFLISDGKDLSTTELFRKIANAMDVRIMLVPFPEWLLKKIFSLFGKHDLAIRLLGSLQINNEKSFRYLNWTPQKTIEESLQNFLSTRKS